MDVIEVTGFSRPRGAWPRATVFDCDGLLADTWPAWRASHVAIASRRRLGADDLDFARLVGASVEGAAGELSTQCRSSVTASEVVIELRRALATSAVSALPGAVELLAALRAHGVPVAVASNGTGAIVGATLRRTGLRALIDVEQVKPAPDVYRAACRALGQDESDCVAFEDSSLGARAAACAGLLVIGVTRDPQQLDVDLQVRSLLDPTIAATLGIPTLRPGRTQTY